MVAAALTSVVFSNNRNNLFDNNYNLVVFGASAWIASPLRAINFKKT